MEDSLPFVPQERVQNRTLERIVDVPVPQIMEDSLPFVPQERVQNRTLEQIVGVPVPQLIEAPVDVLPSTPQECVQNRTQEQIADTPVPQNMEAVGEVVLSTPLERVQNRAPEQIVGFPVPQIVQESVQNCTLEQVSVSPVPQIMEAVVEVFPPTPQVRVQSRIQEQIMDLPVPQIMPALKPFSGKVFTVEMPHQHVHQAYPGDYVVFNIKGLDKHNMPRSGDVMVPASQIQEQIVDVGGTGIVREILEEQVVERIKDSARLVEQNMINKLLRLVMDGMPRPRACNGALNFTPHGGKRLRAMAVCTFGMCTLARRSGTCRRTMRARTNTSTLRMWRKTTQGESAHDSMAVFGQ